MAYGYTAPSYGYRAPAAPRQRQPVGPLAMAAAGAGAPSPQDPFGLLSVPHAGQAVIPELSSQNQPAAHTVAQQQPQAPMPMVVPQATTPGAAAAPTPSTSGFQFDLNTDPALQAVKIDTGQSDAQAQAAALAAKQQALVDYGDQGLAASVLGANDPFTQAAAQNQESTLAQLGRQRDQALSSFETQLDPSLTFSGYKIKQENQLGQNYQDTLAKAAAAIRNQLSGIGSQLSSALGQNKMTRDQALAQARDAAIAAALANPPATSTVPPAGGGTGGLGGDTGTAGGGGLSVGPTTAPDVLSALAKAYAQRRAVAT